MNDVQIGFSMVIAALMTAAAIIGFKVARGDKQFGTRCEVALWLFGFLWYAGTLAMHPSFVENQGRNDYLGYTFLMLVISVVVMAGGIVLWMGVFHFLSFAAKKFMQIMAVY